MKRLEIARTVHGLVYCIVCCEKDCTDEEILTFANAKNICGTTGGWSFTHRENAERENQRPMQCADDANRIHVLVGC